MSEISRPKSVKIGLWCNWIFVALTAIGWLGIAHFFAPARAAPNAKPGWWDLQPARNNEPFNGFHRAQLPAILRQA